MIDFRISKKECKVLNELKGKGFYYISRLLSQVKYLFSTENKYFHNAWFRGVIKNLIRKRFITIDNGVLKYIEDDTNILLTKKIEHNRLPSLKDFNVELLVKNDWKIKICPEIEDILPIVNNYYKLRVSKGNGREVFTF